MSLVRCPPVLFLIFNRPDMSQLVFAHIREVRPARLFIAADGPRSNQPRDDELCTQTRKIINLVDWPCELHTLFQQENLGCKVAISTAITWFFENVEEGIILEDDCVPDLSFFTFCEVLLQKYKEDTRIGMISGDQFVSKLDTDESYYFSNFPHIWGWASWRRSWQNYDSLIKEWPKLRKVNWLVEKTGTKSFAENWINIFDKVYNGEINTWSYQVVFMLWTQNQLSIAPTHNLISNIGFGVASTHTNDASSKFSCMPIKPLKFPLVHPKLIYRNLEYDLLELQEEFGFSQRGKDKVNKRLLNYLRYSIKKFLG